jgi:hypothetical protein
MVTIEDKENEKSKVPYSRISEVLQENCMIDNIFISRYEVDRVKWKNTNNLCRNCFPEEVRYVRKVQ